MDGNYGRFVGSMKPLQSKRALITGGTQGVGAALACAMASAGADCVIHGLEDNPVAQETLHRCQDFGSNCQLIFSDLMAPTDQAVSSTALAACEALPGIDLLVNNAGTFIDRPFLEMDADTFERTLRLNLSAGYFLTQWFARRWIQEGVSGRVLFTGSINGLLAESDHTAYDASKGAVAALVRSLCVALAPRGIRVNAIAPGLVRTPLTNRVLAKDPAALAWMQIHTPNLQVPCADVCGGAAVFLLSDAAQHIHGQTLYIDGGMSAWQQPDLPANLRPHIMASISAHPDER
jgi:NAD(P)-dependent dehydrogenase (short-subunit alcohol dehydrogenase family)